MNAQRQEELSRLGALAAEARQAERAAEVALAARNEAIVRSVKAGATVREIADAAQIAPSTVSWLTTQRLDVGPRKRGRRAQEPQG